MDKESFLTATHWGVYRAEVRDGEIAEMAPFEEDPDPSPIGKGIIDALNAPSRITAPAVRESWLKDGPGSRPELRGKEPFVEISWEQVEELVAKEITRVREQYGSNAIYAGSYGWASAGRFHHAQSQLKRFLNCSGGFTSSVFTYSFAAAEAMMPHVLGSFREFLNTTTSWSSIAEAGELVVAFGGIPLKNGQIDSGGLGAHRQKEGVLGAHAAGVEFVNISPLKSDMMKQVGAEWLPARPNSDVALMLGIAHTLVQDGLYDEQFLNRYCVGFERFAEYLLGKTDGVVKDALWASALSDVPAQTIRLLAKRMASKTTMISVSWSLTRQHHGEQPFWMAITLAAMLGQIGKPGGGFGFGYSASNSIGADYPLLKGGSLPQGDNPVPDFIPVARIADMLLNPGDRFSFNGQERTYPDIHLVWWAGGNPYHHHQDLNRLKDAWTKPDTILCNDWCWNANAKHADIVLPCTTHVERNDIGLSQRDSYMIRMEKAVEAPGEARDDYEIFRGIARWMNIEPAFSEGRNADEWIKWIFSRTTVSDGKTGDLASNQVLKKTEKESGLKLPDWEKFCEKGWHQFDTPQMPRVMLKDFIENPEMNALATPSGKIEIFSSAVASFQYQDCPGHPIWAEPYEWLGNASKSQLHLISNQPGTKLHSQLDQGSVSRAAKLQGREPVMLNPDDAKARDIENGDPVRLYNERGSCLGVAALSEDIRQGVIQMSTGAWWDPDENGMCRHGNPNALTHDKGTSSLGQGPTAHTCLVLVERFDGIMQRVQAFEPPQIIKS
ncbi:MAG: molybdopterin guanine dinucleotide-containing S/N-oxide reductase [Pseudomonadota bacterium]